jgi:thiol:disulfide interchange protein DsbA
VLLVLAVAACSKGAPPTTDAPPPTAAAPAAAPAQQKPPAPAEAGDAAPLMSAGLVAGTDYDLIDNGAPFDTPPGKVEVVEFFNYACPACNAFEPLFEKWKQSLPADAHLVYLPLDFRPDFVPYARAYFAAQALGIAEKSHEAVYRAIHETHQLPGEGTPASADTLAQFYAQFGVDPGKFKKLMESPEIAARVTAGRDFAKRCKVHGTPSIVIGGKYLVKGQTVEGALQNATQLIGMARAG